MYIYLACSLILYITLKNKKIKINYKIILYIIIYYLLILAMLWRHNAIVTIYPIVLFTLFQEIKNNEKMNNILKIFIFFISSFIIAIFMVIIIKITPHIIISSNEGYISYNSKRDEVYEKYGYIIDYFKWQDINDRFAKNAPNAIFIQQIIACAAPNNDDSLIPRNWYEYGKTFEDAKEIYYKNKVFADPLILSFFENRVFNPIYLEKLPNIWLKYILKYPKDFAKHILNYTIVIMKRKEIWIPSYNQINNLEGLQLNYKEYNIYYSDLRKIIYNKLKSLLPSFNYYIFSIISIIVFLSSIIRIFSKNIKNKDITIFSIFISFSSIVTILIVSIFSPDIDTRYLYPTVPLSILSFTSFIFSNIKNINE